MRGSNIQKGAFGEQTAKKYLLENGYAVICSNYRCPYGEIDIIATHEDMPQSLFFIEVKYRKSLKFGMPREAVTVSKQIKIKNTAMNYVCENEITDTNLRFDVIEITDGTSISITHIQNAF